MSKTLFWILSWTWGFILTLIGFIGYSALRVTGHIPRRNQYGWFFEIGENWGGMSIGPFCFVSRNPSNYLLDHEFGHSLQNCYFGPGAILIALASAARYWHREYLYKRKKISSENMPDYDDIWFEGTATYLGQHYHKYTDNNKRV